MANVNPLLLVGAVIGVVTALLVLAYALVKDKKETMGFERTMNDGEILRRLADEEDKCIIVVTHSPTVAQAADVVYRLERRTPPKKPRTTAPVPPPEPASTLGL